jgi:hypothetical protein
MRHDLGNPTNKSTGTQTCKSESFKIILDFGIGPPTEEWRDLMSKLLDTASADEFRNQFEERR